jgi:parallel beta-helix repeat protein/predicted outer membrane repeat protein
MSDRTKSPLSGKALFIILPLILLPSFLHATVINIPADQPTIQEGINFAVNGDTVLVQSGTYLENINYNGKLISVGSLFLTTGESAYISSTVIDGNGSRVAYFHNQEDATALLSGFTITHGSAASGGGILCSASSPSLQNLIVTDNYANNGGGIYCYNYSSPALESIEIVNNSVLYDGGGLNCSGDSNPSLQNIIISGNSSNDCGGGICCEGSSPSLQYVTISGNSATYGGGIYCYTNSSASLQNVTISGNSASDHGGGIFCHDSNPSLQNVTISGNSAATGGGIFITVNSSPSLQYVTISGNSATYGGGIYCVNNSSASLQNVTISGNPATYGGGGIYCYTNSSLSLISSILWNNPPQEIYSVGSVTATYSDIQGGWEGTGNIDSDPLFVDPAMGDYHLTWADFPIPNATMSPCIDTGDPSSPLDPDGSVADMGAFYYDIIGYPTIVAVADIPNDQGRFVQVRWNRSPYDLFGSPVTIESYSVWRFDDIFRASGSSEVYQDPREIIAQAVKNNDRNYYWQRDDEILTFITQLPAVGYDQYSVIAPTLADSSYVSISYSAFQVLAHTEIPLMFYTSLPDSGYSVDNIAPDATTAFAAALNGSTVALSWDEVEYGTFEGNSYPEQNGIWYRVYAGDTPWFPCDEEHLVATVTEPYFDYPVSGETKKFFRVVVSDQQE